MTSPLSQHELLFLAASAALGIVFLLALVWACERLLSGRRGDRPWSLLAMRTRSGRQARPVTRSVTQAPAPVSWPRSQRANILVVAVGAALTAAWVATGFWAFLLGAVVAGWGVYGVLFRSIRGSQ